MRKLKKLLRSPGPFLRDFLIKRYPFSLSEVGCTPADEAVLIAHDLELATLEAGEHAPIDVVFTWVDNSDPKWRQEFENAKAATQPVDLGQYATDSARFTDHDELKFALHGVLKFMPWVNNIYLVTAGQRPSWFEPSSRITLIDHKRIIPEQYLPTFNSHVIEAHLHKIPGLSEHFIYFNDDVFVARFLPKSHFFRSNGIASIFVGKKRLSVVRSKKIVTPTLQASEHSLRLLSRHYLHNIDTPLVHTYIPLRRRAFDLAWKLYGNEIDEFLGNRFRGHNDLNLASFLVPWLAYLEGLAVPARDICYYFNIRSPAAPMFYRALTGNKMSGRVPHSFCANDFRSEGVGETNYRERLVAMLSNYYFG